MENVFLYEPEISCFVPVVDYIYFIWGNALIQVLLIESNKTVEHIFIHLLCAFVSSCINVSSSSVNQRQSAIETGRGMKREAGEHRAPGPPTTCSTSRLAVRAGPAVERARARARVRAPLTTPTRRKSLPNPEPERTRSDGCSSSGAGLCLRRRARERYYLQRNGHRAHLAVKRSLTRTLRLRVSPRGVSLHRSV